ncbi:MAG TPA: response regulator transcription factor [Fluviicola sp.]|nr:response regulator transcription factor [Fluviicola sp.]
MLNTKKILLVEDEFHVVSFIRKGLTEEGFEVSVAPDGISGLKMTQSATFDLIILDIMLPGMSGIEVCAEIRKTDALVPILFLTALGTAENVVLGLESGADDYLVKPFKFIELMARIKSLLRRVELQEQTEHSGDDVYVFEDLVLNDYTKQVIRNGKQLMLTSTEYRLLLLFLRNRNRVLSRPDILETVWGIDYNMGTNVVDVYVNYLRKKLDAAGGQKLIHTVIGMGYVLKAEHESTT